MIHVHNLVKQYAHTPVPAVNGVSFDVPQGSFFALLGPNGAGKTTIISILTTMLRLSSGSAQVAGFDIDQEPQEVRKRIGVIFQNSSLDKNLSGEQNLRLHAQLYGVAPFRVRYAWMPTVYKQKVMELTQLLGLEQAIFKPVSTYSGGMRRKLEVARSLLHNPLILFLDEPTSGLDPLSRRTLWKYLLKLRREQGTTLVLTTHYLEEAESADYVVLLRNGQVAQAGSPTELKKMVKSSGRNRVKKHSVRQTLEDAYLDILGKDA